MTRSSNSNPDYTLNDMGVPERRSSYEPIGEEEMEKMMEIRLDENIPW